MESLNRFAAAAAATFHSVREDLTRDPKRTAFLVGTVIVNCVAYYLLVGPIATFASRAAAIAVVAPGIGFTFSASLEVFAKNKTLPNAIEKLFMAIALMASLNAIPFLPSTRHMQVVLGLWSAGVLFSFNNYMKDDNGNGLLNDVSIVLRAIATRLCPRLMETSG